MTSALLPHRRDQPGLASRIPDHVANRLRTYLDCYTSPRNKRLGDVDELPLSRRRRVRISRDPLEGSNLIPAEADHQERLQDDGAERCDRGQS